jgi:Mn-dependent DtxR family transcriptional regulator
MGEIVVTQPSDSVGDYLKAVWEVAGSGTAATKRVADRLSVSSASVSNMFARLQGMGLALYEPYRGPPSRVGGALRHYGWCGGTV